MPGTHCYVPQCINRGNGHVINNHLQAKNTSAGRAARYVITAESKYIIFFFLILWLFDFPARLLLLVLQAPVVLFTHLFQSYA